MSRYFTSSGLALVLLPDKLGSTVLPSINTGNKKHKKHRKHSQNMHNFIMSLQVCGILFCKKSWLISQITALNKLHVCHILFVLFNHLGKKPQLHGMGHSEHYHMRLALPVYFLHQLPEVYTKLQGTTTCCNDPQFTATCCYIVLTTVYHSELQ